MTGLFRIVWVIAALMLTACAAPKRPPPPQPQALPTTVVLVSIDALPAHVVGTGAMPTLDALAASGVRADWMRPSYPTLTFPNHYTLVTGLRPDRHGVVHNNMRDATLGEFRSKSDSARDGRWWGGEPIWATLQRQGGIAATMFWPGSEAQIAGQRPHHFRAFDGTIAATARVQQVLDWLDLPTDQRPRLLTLYLEQYDVAAHAHGVRSAEARQALRELDAALAQLRDGLQARGLAARTDLLVVSDHGMADAPRDQVRFLEDLLPDGIYDTPHWGSIAGIVPKPGHAAEVSHALVGRHDHFTCWKKADLPARWHYGGHARVPPIICQADVGWRVQLRSHPPSHDPIRGEHGYAPEDPAMRAVFVASGPSFRQARIRPFDNVDVYPLLARLLQVQPAANDGDVRVFAPALQSEAAGRR